MQKSAAYQPGVGWGRVEHFYNGRIFTRKAADSQQDAGQTSQHMIWHLERRGKYNYAQPEYQANGVSKKKLNTGQIVQLKVEHWVRLRKM